MKSLLSACLLLALSSNAVAVLPYGRFWIWTIPNDFSGNQCARVSPGGPCKLYQSHQDACRDLSNYGFSLWNPSAGDPPAGATPNRYAGCLANHQQFGGCAVPSSPCGVGLALEMPANPFLQVANANCSGTTCTCNTGSNQALSACSGGKNNGTDCPTCPQANPVNPASGNKVQQQLVYRGLNGFELSLVYNMYNKYQHRLGN